MTLDYIFKKRQKERFVDDDVSYCDNITGIKKHMRSIFS
jgi:hypothetical protein